MVSVGSAHRCGSSTSPVGPYFLCSCKESKQRKHAPKSASVRRVATDGSPLGAPCSGSRRRDILSRRRSAGRPVRLTHCARRSNRRSQGFEQLLRHLTARYASPQNNAKRSERCAVALACDVGPLMAHRAAQRAQGSAGRSPPSFVATGMSRRNSCPEHVSSAGHPHRGCAIRACFLLVTFLYTSKEKSLGLQAEIELAVTNQGSYQSLPSAAA